MTTTQTLEEKVQKLQKRVDKLEQQILALLPEHEFNQALYQKTKELASQNYHLSAIALQKKFMIDLPRAKWLMGELRRNGLLP
jgi:DNA-binding SARP family transcriptional activator